MLKNDRFDELALLIQSVSDRCEASFGELYRVTSPVLFGIVLRVIEDRGEAEDVLQDVYVKVWNRCHQFDPLKGRPISWLGGIARNAAVDALREGARRPRPAYVGFPDDDPYADTESEDLSAFEVLSRKRASDAVRKCLLLLSADQRESLSLAYYHGLTHAEIALRLRRPLGTIKSQVRRALVMMRTQLTEPRVTLDSRSEASGGFSTGAIQPWGNESTQ